MEKEPQQVAAEVKEEEKEVASQPSEGHTLAETPLETEKEEEVEDSTYYSNSFWQVSRDFKLEDLLQDY